MTVATRKIERSGPAVRATLGQFSPPECVLFEQQFQQALVDAGQRFDLAPVQAVLDRWWPIAAIRANPLSPAEQELVTRARAGDDTGWADRPQVAEPARRQMPRYTAPWLQIPLGQYAALPTETQRQIDDRVEQLLDDPEGPTPAYDPPSDQWTTTYGDGAGLILYAVVHSHRRVLILRLI